MHHITARPTEPGTGAIASEARAVTVWSKILVVGQNICSHHHICYQRGMKSQGESGVSRHSPRLAFTRVDWPCPGKSASIRCCLTSHGLAPLVMRKGAR